MTSSSGGKLGREAPPRFRVRGPAEITAVPAGWRTVVVEPSEKTLGAGIGGRGPCGGGLYLRRQSGLSRTLDGIANTPKDPPTAPPTSPTSAA